MCLSVLRPNYCSICPLMMPARSLNATTTTLPKTQTDLDKTTTTTTAKATISSLSQQRNDDVQPTVRSRWFVLFPIVGYLATTMSHRNGASGLAPARGGGHFSSSSKDGSGGSSHNHNPSSSSVQVVVRLRPLNDKEKKHGTLPVVSASTNDKTVTVIKGSGSRQVKTSYKFDHVFTAFSTQEEVFQATLQPVIRDVLMGFESTVFAYGQTGT
jgi:Kinesin motor domain